jgi:hypothetical protein
MEEGERDEQAITTLFGEIIEVIECDYWYWSTIRSSSTYFPLYRKYTCLVPNVW